MCKVNLSQLVGGQSFTMPYTISKNGLGIKTRTLVDTGVNGYIFIDSRLAQKASQFLDAPIRTLGTPY
jgi:predicted aspartyl protease